MDWWSRLLAYGFGWESCDNSVMWLWKLFDVKVEVCKVEYIVSELILVT